MDTSIVTGNPENSFWDQNPELRYITAFANLIVAEGEEKSSKIMWCVNMIENPDSRLFRMSKEDKLKELYATYLKGSGIKIENYLDTLVPEFNRICLTEIKVAYKSWSKKMLEFSAYIDTLSFGKNSELIDILSKAEKLFISYERVKKQMEQENAKTRLRGGAIQSHSEKRANRRRNG